jgi:hypothetical protein
MPIWQPDNAAVEGWMIEVPVRSPNLPVNLWVHWSGLATNWAGFPPVLTDGDWHRVFGILTVPVPDGDTVLAGQGSLSIASAHREETSLFNTDDWGMALDSVGVLPSPVQGVGNVLLPTSFAVLGNCWPVAVALNVDLLVLRTSLIPATAQPYGQRPKPKLDLTSDRAKLVTGLARVSQLSGKIKDLISQLDEASAALQESLPEPLSPAPDLPRRSTVGLSFSAASLTTFPVGPERPPRGTRPPREQPPAGEGSSDPRRGQKPR